MRDNRHPYIIKLAATQRYIMWHALPKIFRHVRLTEFPKSGGTWLGQMISEMMDVPFPRNTWMTTQRGVQHSHLPGPIGDNKTILLVRDGRDVVVSAYYHFIIGHDHSPPHLNDKWRQLLRVEDIEDVSTHLPKFIDIFFSTFNIGGKSVNWAEHVDSFDLSSQHLLLIKYEELLTDATAQLHRIASFYNLERAAEDLSSIVEKYSFENQANRIAGVEDQASFLRKGVAGDWKIKFTPASIAAFDKWAGVQLKKLGYID